MKYTSEPIRRPVCVQFNQHVVVAGDPTTTGVRAVPPIFVHRTPNLLERHPYLTQLCAPSAAARVCISSMSISKRAVAHTCTHTMEAAPAAAQ